MSLHITSQIPTNLMFRYRISCRRFDGRWSNSVELPPEFRIPSFGIFDVGTEFADFRIGWNPGGLLVWCEIRGKMQTIWCRATQLLESDGIRLWIDTRDSHDVHRASKFCHALLLLPTGNAAEPSRPFSTMVRINRAKEESPAINNAPIPIASRQFPSGYALSAFLPSQCLHGWNTEEHKRIGFAYAITDRELGSQTLAANIELPLAEDPSLWSSLDLV
jgi:hypothetical protein